MIRSAGPGRRHGPGQCAPAQDGRARCRLLAVLVAGVLLPAGLMAPAGVWAQAAREPEPGAEHLRTVQPFTAATAMVVTANPLASQAGLEVLRAGGNAVDAAVAAALALNVVEPQSSGVGGGGFILLYLAKRHHVLTIDGREEAPAAATPNWFLAPDGKPQLFYPDRITGGRPVGVPGMVRALAKASRLGGRLPWARLLGPAQRLAEEGFAISPRLATELREQQERLGHFAATRAVFFGQDGQTLPAGTTLRQPELARTLRLLAERGPDAFYTGALARSILDAVNQADVNPGRMAATDLAQYRAVLRQPVQMAFRGTTVYGMGPPSSGGVGVLQILGLWERAPQRSLQPVPTASAAWLHRFAQAVRLAYADRDAYLADADFIPVPVQGLLDPGYLADRAHSLDWDAPLAPVAAGHPPGAPALSWTPSQAREHRSTTHLVVVDGERNVVSLTASIEQAFGSAMVVPGWGFLLNNELTDFDAEPTDAAGAPRANRVEGQRRPRRGALDGPRGLGGKRPRSSMAPTLVLRNGKPLLALGSPGGPTIIQYVAWVLLRVVEGGQSLQEAIQGPLMTQRGNQSTLEPEARQPGLEEQLAQLGHQVRWARQGSGLHGIAINPLTGTLEAGVDPRREGMAVGY